MLLSMASLMASCVEVEAASGNDWWPSWLFGGAPVQAGGQGVRLRLRRGGPAGLARQYRLNQLLPHLLGEALVVTALEGLQAR